ncbi:MAG: hypothetical protein AAF483_01895 [Planctomycetota bacterium]
MYEHLEQAVEGEVLQSKTTSQGKQDDFIEFLATSKRIPVSSFRKFGVDATFSGRNRKQVARVEAYNESGEVHSHFDISEKDAGAFKRGDGNKGLFFPGRLPKLGEQWCLVEGVIDAAALDAMGFNVVGLPASHMSGCYARLFEGVHCFIVAKLDEVCQRGAKVTGGILKGIAASIRLVRLPGEIIPSRGASVRDVIRKAGEQAVKEAISDAAEWMPTLEELYARDSRPEVVVTTLLSVAVDSVCRHIGRLGWESSPMPVPDRESRKLYQRGGMLVDVVTESKPDSAAKGSRIKIAKGTPRIRVLPTSQLALRITDACNLVIEKTTSEGIQKEQIPPPKWLIDGIHTLGEYGDSIRHLEAIVTAPTIRPDGSVLQEPGWDACGLLFKPSMKFAPIPDKPSRADAEAAAKIMLNAVADFPFVANADESAWLAMLLSKVGRPCIKGHVPLFIVTANVPGAGKTLLVDVASIIAYGHDSARTAYVADDNEMRKRITSIVMEGAPAILMDNVDQPIGGASLDAVLTAERWKDRELQTNRTIDLPVRTVWSATGNNLRFRSDVARRVVPIRLDSTLERPETRDDFRHPNLLAWVRNHRSVLVTASLTVLRAYFVAGCPKQSGGQFGSFENWSSIVRGAIVWAGCADPMETVDTARAEDDSAAVLSGLIRGLQEVDPNGEGVSSREIADLLNNVKYANQFPAMHEVATEIATKNGKTDARLLGNQFKKYLNRVANGFRITKSEERSRLTKWRVESVKDDA